MNRWGKFVFPFTGLFATLVLLTFLSIATRAEAQTLPISITAEGDLTIEGLVPAEVTLSGPVKGAVNFFYTFTASVDPISTTIPITYAWQVDGVDLITHTGGLTDTVDLIWETTGTKQIMVSAANAGGFVTATAQIEIIQYQILLPILRTAIPGLKGAVTENGSPAPGVSLTLMIGDGYDWYTGAQTSTDSDGSYFFQNPPVLLPGQFYYIRFLNESDPSRLYIWNTNLVAAYDGKSSITFPTFDIANVELKSPQSGASVSVPVTFSWTIRPASPTDSYEFNLFDLTYYEPYFYTDPPLGYVGSYRLEKQPDGFYKRIEYGWAIVVYSPDAGIGASYYYYLVTFK